MTFVQLTTPLLGCLEYPDGTYHFNLEYETGSVTLIAENMECMKEIIDELYGHDNIIAVKIYLDPGSGN